MRIFDEEDNRKYYFRTFLNPESAGGTALIEVEISHYKESDYSGSEFGCHLTLKDCNRQMTLDFDCRNEEQRRERLQKLAFIESQLKHIRKGLEEFEFKPKLEKPKKKKKGKKKDG